VKTVYIGPGRQGRHKTQKVLFYNMIVFSFAHKMAVPTLSFGSAQSTKFSAGDIV